MEEKEILANNLSKYRKNAGLSQLELAKKLNYSNKNISKWENGETMPNAFVLSKIAKIYGVTIEDLLSGSAENVETEKISKSARTRKFAFRLIMLLLANAIMYAVGTALIYGLHLAEISGFNIWLIYLYLAPFTFLSIVIFVRVLYKYIEIISLSAFGWLICTALYLSLMNVEHMEFIFALGGAYEVIVLCMAFLISIKLRGGKLRKSRNKKEDRKNPPRKNQSDESKQGENETEEKAE